MKNPELYVRHHNIVRNEMELPNFRGITLALLIADRKINLLDVGSHDEVY